MEREYNDWYAFTDWLRENGYQQYRKNYDIRASRGEDPDVIYNDYTELEDEFVEWCDEHGYDAITDWE